MGGDIADIKPTFVVPDSIQWPEGLRGMALGQKLAYLRWVHALSRNVCLSLSLCRSVGLRVG